MQHNVDEKTGIVAQSSLFAAAFAAVLVMLQPPAVHADTPDASGAAAIRSFDITFSGYAGEGSLTDFPVLVRLSPALNGFDYSRCRADGSDVRFTDASGNLLSREIDTWNPGGESLVWVKVPSLTASTKITCLYGFAGAAPGSASDVWSNGYAAVWHLGESALPLADSAAAPAPFASSNCLTSAAFAAAGKLGGAVDFSQAVANSAGKIQSWVSAADTDKLDGFADFTVELWTYAVTTTTGQQMYMGKRDDTSRGAWWIYQNSGETAKMNLTASASGGTDTANAKSIAAVTPSFNAWNHVAFVRDTTAKKGYAYLAGECAVTNNPSAPMNTSSVTNCAGAFYLGNNFAVNNNRCQGKIDELRISRVARSADWIRTSYDCVENAAFATYTASAAQTANDWGRYARKFTVSFPGAPAGALADFPVLVKVSENHPAGFSYADCLKPHGGDLRFADANGNLLPSEVDTWNTSGESLVWVRVPSLSASARISAYYGWAEAPAIDGSKVWDSDYVGVWHLGEGALPLAESTGVSTPFNVSSNLAANGFAAAGKIGGAVDFTQTEGGTRPWLSAADDDDLDGFDSFTVEVWTKRSSTTGNKYILSKRVGTSIEFSYGIIQTATPAGAMFVSSDGSTSATILAGGDGMNLGWDTWLHQAYVRDVANVVTYGYVDGARLGSRALASTDTLFAGASPLYLGNYFYNRPEAFNGQIDEVRISRVARSAEWVKASRDTVADGAFARYSATRGNNDAFVIVVR